MLRGNENAALVEQVLAKLEAKNPDYAPLKKYKADMAEAKAQKERLAEGKVAPEFSFRLRMEIKTWDLRTLKARF